MSFTLVIVIIAFDEELGHLSGLVYLPTEVSIKQAGIVD